MSNILKRAKILEPTKPNLSTKLFGGEASGILNYNNLAYPHLYTLRQRIRSLFWSASEVDMSSDAKQFSTLPEEEQVAFLKIIGLLATLDAPQTVMAKKISDFATDPVIKSIMATIADQESEHNHSYAYVLSSVTTLSKQLESFEQGRVDEVLLKRNERVVEIYNDFAVNPNMENLLKSMVYTALLEGLYFYSSFAFFYNLARNNKMVGTSTMISYINRDELEHGKAISDIFRATLGENPEYNNDEFIEWVYDQFKHSVEQEIKWSYHALDKITGINLKDMEGYIKYRANKMLRLLGLSEIYPEHTENTMKWIKAYVDNFDGTKTDFFEEKPRSYVKTSDENGFDDL